MYGNKLFPRNILLPRGRTFAKERALPKGKYLHLSDATEYFIQHYSVYSLLCIAEYSIYSSDSLGLGEALGDVGSKDWQRRWMDNVPKVPDRFTYLHSRLQYGDPILRS